MSGRLGYSRAPLGTSMPIRAFIIIALVACAASGCGRRGSLEDPAAPASTLAPAGTPAAGFGDFLPEADDPEAPPPAAPQRRFFLDFLL